LAKEDGNWVFPSERDDIKKISLSNLTARKFILVIHRLGEIVFLLHDDGGKKGAVPEYY
jgi:hypothetical protein